MDDVTSIMYIGKAYIIKDIVFNTQVEKLMV